MPNQIEVTMHCQWCGELGHATELDKPYGWTSVNVAVSKIHGQTAAIVDANELHEIYYLCSVDCVNKFMKFVVDLPRPSKELSIGF